MKKGMKLTSILLAISIVLTLLPTTALAALAAPKKLFVVHTAEGEDKNWSTTYESYLELLSKASGSHNWAAWTERTDDGLVDLRITHTNMTDAERTDRSVAPYFNVTGGKYQVSKILLQPMNLGDNQPEEVTNYSATVDTLTVIAEKDCYEGKTRVRGYVTVNYVWEFIPEGSEEDKPDTYTVHYTLNQGDAANQLPSNVRPANNSGLRKDFAIAEGGTFSLLPANTDATDLTLQKFSAEGYDLIGWKCEDEACTVCTGENAAFHQIGESVEATAARATDGVITLTAQWKKWEVPSVEDIGELDLSNDPPMLVLATVNGKGEMVKITQHSAETGEAVTDELMLDPSTSEIYYEATVKMDPSVAGSLKAYITSPTFAQFKITVNMAEQLKLAGIGEDGTVEFTFTCPFLEPVSGSEVLVDGQPVPGVEVSTNKSPYIYRVPADSLTNTDGTIKPFSFLVQWRSTDTNGGIYSADDLSAPMTLKTAKATATSKVPFETTGSVTGWINPKGNLPQNPNQEKGLAYAILNNSPTLKKYLMTDKSLSYEQATSVMLDYLASEDGQNASMKREILPANTLAAYNPCVVTFVNGDNTIDTQYIKYENPATPTDKLPAYSGGMDFDGWYIQGTTTRFDFTTDMVTDDMVLEARWSDHNHDWSEWTVTREPTCAAGERSHTCSICGREERESIPAVAPHTWGEWIRISDPTYTETGLDRHTCSVCGETEDRILDRLAYTPNPVFPTPTPVTPSNPTPTPTPDTNIGDEDVPLAAPGLNTVDHFDYIKGYGDGTVRPDDFIKRSEVATIFFRLMTEEFRSENWATENAFSDVNTGDWYNNAISTAANAGILRGYADGSFQPNKAITRAEFAAIAARFASDVVPVGGMFSDIEGHWAQEDIERAAAAGWIQGSNGLFRPNDKITRAEAITLINRMLDRVPDEEHLLEGMITFTDNVPGKWYYADVQEATNSHDYDRDEFGATEIWNELLDAVDWTALEKAWATAATSVGVNVAGDLTGGDEAEGESLPEEVTGDGE